MQTRLQRRLGFFMTLCQEWYDQRQDDGEWYDRVALSWVLQCETYRQAWQAVVLPYNETYFREEIQSLWDTAGHLVRHHEIEHHVEQQQKSHANSSSSFSSFSRGCPRTATAAVRPETEEEEEPRGPSV